MKGRKSVSMINVPRDEQPPPAKRPKFQETPILQGSVMPPVTALDADDVWNIVSRMQPEERQKLLHRMPPQSVSVATSSSYPSSNIAFNKKEDTAVTEQREIGWMDRSDLDLVKTRISVSAWMHAFLHRSANGRDYGYVIIAGGSGSGKTRTGIELPGLLSKSLLHGWRHCHVFHHFMATKDTSLNFKYEKPQPDEQTQLAAESWLKDNLASSYGVVSSSIAKLSLEEVLIGVRTAEGTPSDCNMLLFFQLDEFQQNLPFCTHLCRRLSQLLSAGDNSPFHKTKTLLVPIFTGTWGGLLDLATFYGRHVIMLAGFPTLSITNSFFSEAWRAVQRQHGTTQPTQPSFGGSLQHLQLLSFLGNIPRMVRMYALRLFSSKMNVEHDFTRVFEDVASYIGQNYGFQMAEDIVSKHLLVLWYFRTPVPYTYALNGVTIEDLQPMGYLFLKQLSDSADLYFVDIPFVFVHQWAKIIFNHPIFVEPLYQLSEENLPKFCLTVNCATYAMLKMAAEVELTLCQTRPGFIPSRKWTQDPQGRVLTVSTTLAELYAHAIEGCHDILHKPIDVSVSDYYYYRKLQPGEDVLEGNFMIETKNREAGADGLTPITAEQYKSSPKYAVERKFSPKEQQINGTTLFKEMSKNLFNRPYLVLITPKTVLDKHQSRPKPTRGRNATKLRNATVWNVVAQNSTETIGIGLRHLKPELIGKATQGAPRDDQLVESTFSNLFLIASPASLLKFGRGLIHATRATLEE